MDSGRGILCYAGELTHCVCKKYSVVFLGLIINSLKVHAYTDMMQYSIYELDGIVQLQTPPPLRKLFHALHTCVHGLPDFVIRTWTIQNMLNALTLL